MGWQDAGGAIDNKMQALYTDPDVLETFKDVCRSFLCEESLLFLLAVLDLQARALHLCALIPGLWCTDGLFPLSCICARLFPFSPLPVRVYRARRIP